MLIDCRQYGSIEYYILFKNYALARGAVPSLWRWRGAHTSVSKPVSVGWARIDPINWSSQAIGQKKCLYLRQSVVMVTQHMVA